ncbi:Ferredoxin--NADP reductase [Botrimarina colliarenosi]|uniref:ferredoxin--NADP(+) reductase n=1 Tax=Botrimarina colliarenosi TaxID=2528001 RepID=A0A5C6AD34_9BACT|nr:ferredoxin--NADP reductase [Botrimarina colliarenosi]TWT97085.1 Ferredoxin--NADP reductase [Botrimarina colliarenosi]
METPRLSDEEIAELRALHYNATLTHFSLVNDRLARLRVRLDEGKALGYEPGQYTTLGLGNWEPRHPEADPETHNEKTVRRLAKRAYSISCRLLNDDGSVAAAGDETEIEFYIALVTQAEKAPPAFTPRLFLRQVGDRLEMNPRPKGHFVLGDLKPTDNIVFASTGTGEAPHNAMLAKLLADGHEGRIASLCCVRYRADLGYLAEHHRLMEAYPQYRYVPLTTREKENRNVSEPGYTGAVYVQDLLGSATASAQLGFDLDPRTTKVFLCGNPAMIGIPHKDGHPEGRYPTPRGTVEALEALGFQADEPKKPGNIHYEKYW